MDPSPGIGNERVLTLLEINVGGSLPSIDLRGADTKTDDATASTKAATPAIADSNAARYDQLNLIGRGGLGEVMAAFDHDLRRRVALKRTLHGHSSPDEVRRLVAEAQVTAQLEHPNIPSVHALGIQPDGRPYFTMALIHGMSLGELLRLRRTDPALAAEFSTNRLLRVFLQIGYAIAFAHEHGVLHRDIKPDNVMVGRFGEVRVMDWGLARVIGPPAAATPDVDAPAERAGAAVGTPGYMPPEQVEGSDLDERADVWALGALLYEMLSGKRPIDGATSPEVLTRTVRTDVTSLSVVTAAAAVPQVLTAVVDKALRRDRDERHASVQELMRDVEAVIEGKHPPSIPVAGSRLRRAGRWYVGHEFRTSRLTPMDIDLAFFGAMLAGGAIGVWVASWFTGTAWPWFALLAGIALNIPFYLHFSRRRPADERLTALGLEGVSTDHALSRHASDVSSGAATGPAADPPGGAARDA
ncbi:MAG: serine/threonine-protein kinase [Planctomycetota bacterium]